MRNRIAVLVLAIVTLVSCGGGGGSPTAPAAPTAPPATPAVARLTLGVDLATWTVTSDDKLMACGDGLVTWRITESAGLAATITGSDVYLQHASGEIEGRIVSNDRNDAVPAGGFVTVNASRFFCEWHNSNSHQGPTIMKATLALTDVKGNAFALVGETGFVRK